MIVHAVFPLSWRRWAIETAYNRIQTVILYLKFSGPWRNSLKSDLQDGYLRLYITRKCNCRCKFCDHYLLKLPDVDKHLIYNLLKPVYKKIKMLNLVGGEVTIIPETMKLCDFIASNFPHITIFIETNGIRFDEKYQDFLVRDLPRIHFSVNAVDQQSFLQHVWNRNYPGAEEAFGELQKNLLATQTLLREKGLEVFMPSMSMVVTRENSSEVLPFLKMALEYHALAATFYFNHLETASGNKLSEEAEFDANAIDRKSVV